MNMNGTVCWTYQVLNQPQDWSRIKNYQHKKELWDILQGKILTSIRHKTRLNLFMKQRATLKHIEKYWKKEGACMIKFMLKQWNIKRYIMQPSVLFNNDRASDLHAEKFPSGWKSGCFTSLALEIWGYSYPLGMQGLIIFLLLDFEAAKSINKN